ncbi:sulfurtransferase [Bradyrhizobium sp. 2TAF24]|uniref:sulfurtransferase n=1 Tax=Bradyrhizobium sp. 2TAF24 TaxID=3233011 RepID=UPI003F8FFF2B
MTDRGGVITTAELAEALGAVELRVFDCTTYLEPAPDGHPGPYVTVPGRASFEAAHIPGADFLDLQGEFSDRDSALHFMMPSTAQLAAAFGRHGVGPGTRVVLYSIGSMMWATRVWWMLRALGFDEVAVLDGGFERWTADGRPTESGHARGYPPATFVAAPRDGLFVDRGQVLAALGRADVTLINALGPQFFSGRTPSRYGRPGRIPGSVNVPAASLVDPERKTLITLAAARDIFAARGVDRGKRVIAYCGGGISATLDLFVLHRLGYDDLTLYDASMGEWATDPELPIETD